MLSFAVQLVWGVLGAGAPRLMQHARAQRASGARAPATAGVEPDGPAPAPCAAGAHSCGLQGRTSRRSTCCCAVRRAPSTRHGCAVDRCAALGRPACFTLGLRVPLRPGQYTGRSTREAPLLWRGIARETSDHTASRELAQHTPTRCGEMCDQSATRTARTQTTHDAVSCV
jgi:hypothetical protein